MMPRPLFVRFSFAFLQHRPTMSLLVVFFTESTTVKLDVLVDDEIRVVVVNQRKTGEGPVENRRRNEK